MDVNNMLIRMNWINLTHGNESVFFKICARYPIMRSQSWNITTTHCADRVPPVSRSLDHYIDVGDDHDLGMLETKGCCNPDAVKITLAVLVTIIINLIRSSSNITILTLFRSHALKFITNIRKLSLKVVMPQTPKLTWTIDFWCPNLNSVTVRKVILELRANFFLK